MNHVQSTTRETNAFGNHVPVSYSEKYIASTGNDNEDAGSSSAESAQIKSATKSDTDSEIDSEEKEGGRGRQGLHNKNSNSAHGGALRQWGVGGTCFNLGTGYQTIAIHMASPQLGDSTVI